jgi:hypothetical protein
MESLREFEETEFYGVAGALAEYSLAKARHKKKPRRTGAFLF